MELVKETCKPCEGGIPPMEEGLAKEHLAKLDSRWEILNDNKSITSKFEFKDFSAAISFVNTVAAIAEEQGHHPDINIFSYKNVSIILTTHAISGLSYNDFIVAAKIDAIKKD